MTNDPRTTQDQLTQDELDEQAATELPDREAMSLLEGSLFSGGLSPDVSDLVGGQATGDQPAGTIPDLSSSPIPFKNPLVG